MRIHIFAIVAVCSVLFAAGEACAGIEGPFTFGTEGTVTVDFDAGAFVNESIVSFQDPDFAWETFFAEGTADFGEFMVTTEGRFVVSGAAGDMVADFHGTIFLDENGNGAGAGKFTIDPTRGTGIFEGVPGFGVFTSLSGPFDENGQTFNTLVFQGRFVPAPGALCALGIAGLGLLGRQGRDRRRK